MKKSLLALAVVAVAASANAATVYDKDGTSLTLDGRVQSVYYSNNYNNAGANDSSIQNSGRFGIGGKTQVTDWVAGIGYAQWDVANGSVDADTEKDNGFTARDQYVGADFGEFGLVKAGRYVDSSYYAEEVTDHFEDAAGIAEGAFTGERRGGQLTYVYDNYGVHAELGLQTAQDNARVWGGDKFDVDSGFHGALGYTFDDVVFGPLSFRAGYSYLKGQTGSDAKNDTFKNFKHATAGIAWGNLASGLYLAAEYDYAKLTEPEDDGVLFEDSFDKQKGFELVAGYAFDNGVSFLTGYEAAKFETQDGDFKIKRIPVFVNYKLNSNFNVWGEVGFNAGSDHPVPRVAGDNKTDKTVFSVGARYTF